MACDVRLRSMHVVGGGGFALVHARAGRMDGADLRRFRGSRGLRAASAECRRRQGGQEQCACESVCVCARVALGGGGDDGLVSVEACRLHCI